MKTCTATTTRSKFMRAGSELDNIGLLVDFVELKAAADEVVQYLDHRNINELDPFVELQPSAENLAKYVLERVAAKVGDERVQIYKVRCFETPTSVATYEVWAGRRRVTVSTCSLAGPDQLLPRAYAQAATARAVLYCLLRLLHASSAMAGMLCANTGAVLLLDNPELAVLQSRSDAAVLSSCTASRRI